MKNIEIFMAEGKSMVPSRLIADHFGKQHKHVLDAIREVMANTTKSFNIMFSGRCQDLDAAILWRPPGKM